MANRVEAPRRRKRQLGPADEGRELTLIEFEASDFEPGFRYDLVDGRLEVNPEPNLSHDRPLVALQRLLEEYLAQHPGTFDYVSPRSRVFPGRRRRRGSVGPDLALFTGLQEDPDQEWRDLAPSLVVEALSRGREKKDLVRNRRVYLQVPSIQEYWIVDPRRGRKHWTLRVLVRESDGEWSEQLVPRGGRYETPLFPGLVVDLSLPDLGLAVLVAKRYERVRQAGRAEGRAEGRREGRVEGELGGLRSAIELLLRSRLGAVPPSILERIQAEASVSGLHELLRRASVVQRAEELFP